MVKEDESLKDMIPLNQSSLLVKDFLAFADDKFAEAKRFINDYSPFLADLEKIPRMNLLEVSGLFEQAKHIQSIITFSKEIKSLSVSDFFNIFNIEFNPLDLNDYLQKSFYDYLEYFGLGKTAYQFLHQIGSHQNTTVFEMMKQLYSHSAIVNKIKPDTVKNLPRMELPEYMELIEELNFAVPIMKNLSALKDATTFTMVKMAFSSNPIVSDLTEQDVKSFPNMSLHGKIFLHF